MWPSHIMGLVTSRGIFETTDNPGGASAAWPTLQDWVPYTQPAAERDCRKTPGSNNVHKNLPQQAKKLPKRCQNVVRNTKNQTLFSVSVPLFKNYF